MRKYDEYQHRVKHFRLLHSQLYKANGENTMSRLDVAYHLTRALHGWIAAHDSKNANQKQKNKQQQVHESNIKCKRFNTISTRQVQVKLTSKCLIDRRKTQAFFCTQAFFFIFSCCILKHVSFNFQYFQSITIANEIEFEVK